MPAVHDAPGALTPVPAPPGAAAGYAERVRALLRNRLGDVLLLGVITGLLDILRVLPLVVAVSLPLPEVLARVVASATVMSTMAVVGVTLAQALALRGWPRTVAMVAGGVLSAVAMAGLSIVWRTFSPFGGMSGAVTSHVSTAMYLAWEYAAVATAVALFYAAREREAQLASAARESELAQQRVQRTMMEARLAVLRASVEPEFLFAALEEVRGLYRRDGIAAAEMLDALIVYLRAALPQMRGEASTVGREVDLVAAYVGVLQVPRRAVLQCEAHAGIEARELELPPMVLLPLAQAAFAGGEADRRRRFTIEAIAHDDGARVAIEVAGGRLPGAWRDEGPEAVVRTLRAWFGAGASLHFASAGAIHRVELRLPAAAA